MTLKKVRKDDSAISEFDCGNDEVNSYIHRRGVSCGY